MATRGKKVTDRKDDQENASVDPRESGGAGTVHLTEKQQERIRQSIELMAKTRPMKIDELLPYQRNQKDHPEEQVRNLANSLRRFGWRQPVVIDERNVIVIGHGRVLGAKMLGLTEAPVVSASDLTEDEIRELRIIDNKLNESDWNKYLEEDVQELTFEGFENLDFEAIGGGTLTSEDIHDDEYEGTVPEEPKAKLGDIYELGEHRLMCGDSTSSENWRLLMCGQKADMLFTDPPYGVAIGDKNKALNEVQKAGRCTENIEGDTMSEADLYNMLKECFVNCRENCSDDAVYYVTSPQGGSLGLMMMMMRDAGLEVRHVLMWVKNSATFSLGRLDYDYQHEPIFYTWTKNHHNYRGGENRTTIWQYDKPRKCDLHPTMKPVELVANAILDGTQEGMIVMDAFCGSGTTIIAAEQTKRKARCMELDPKYVDVIIDRWEQFTGKKAVKIN